MELNLPKNSSGTEGYHLKCYKNFSAIMAKFKVEASEGGSTSASGTSTPAPRESTTGSETSACTTGELTPVSSVSWTASRPTTPTSVRSSAVFSKYLFLVLEMSREIDSPKVFHNPIFYGSATAKLTVHFIIASVDIENNICYFSS